MRKFLLLMTALVSGVISFGQLSGVYSIPGGYPTIASAIASLNTFGVGPGGVVFNVAANYTETFPSPTSGLITATGTPANPILFQKSGAGADPLITAGTGTSTTTDGIIKIAGGDYITFDGIDVAEKSTNTNPTTQMEWGYALVKKNATAPFDGCQYVTIKNCAITLNKANTSSVGIYSGTHTATSTTPLSITATSDATNNCKFYNNLTSNVYIGRWVRGMSDGVPGLYDTNNEIGEDGGETISNFGGGSATAYGIYAIYQSGLKVGNNDITGGSGTSTLYGIFISAGTGADIYNNTVTIEGGATTSSVYGISNASGVAPFTCNIYGNTVTSCSYPTATSGAFTGIVSTGTPTTLNLYSNSVINNTLSGTGAFTGMDGGSPANLNMYGNTVDNNTKTSPGNLYCMRAGTSVISLHDNTIHTNTISTTGTVTAAGSVYGYLNTGSPTAETHYNNQIHDLSISGTTTSNSSVIYGMYTNTVPGDLKNWYLNVIYNLSVNTAGSGAIYGLTSGSGATVNIYRNRIYGISACGASGSVYGIYLTGGTSANIYNNMVGDLHKPAANAETPLAGIYIAGGTTVNAYYNTVYLNTTSSGALFGSAAVLASTTPILILRNNIFVNTSTPKGAGVTAAYRRTGNTLTTYGIASNNNCFYAGTPSSTNAIFYDGTSYQSLASYQALVAPRDNSSVTELPAFISTISPVNLHIYTPSPTLLESGGTAIPGYDNDYDNDIRQGSTGYAGTGTAPDIGADEFGGIFPDLNPPVIAYTPLANTTSTSSRTLTATVTDISGVPVTGTGMPALYWRINAGSYIAAPPVYLGSNQYQYTFGSGVAAGDAVYYYIVARDMYSTPHVGSFPAAGAGGFSYDPPAAAIPPSNPSNYSIVTPLSGDYLVGAGLTYPTITAAVADLNLRGVSAPVRFLLQDAGYTTAESYPIIVNVTNANLPTATNTVTIKPAAGVTAVITGVAANSPIFSIRTSYITIDGSNTTGGVTRDLTITNSSATGPRVIGISSAATTPVAGSGVKNCTIINGSTASPAIVTSAVDGSPGYFNTVSIVNNSVRNAYTGIENIAVAVPGNGNGLLVANNDLNTAGAGAILRTGIYVQGVDGATVTGNTVGNISNAADASGVSGIWLSAGTVNSTVSGNTVSAISGTASAPRGIAISPGVANSGILVSDNTVNALTSPSTGTTYGICVYGPVSGVTVQRNRISNIKNTNSTECGADGIGLGSTMSAAALTVKNNFIWDIAGYGYNSLTLGNGYGIEVSSGGGYSIYFNSISLSTGQTSATGLPACLLIGPAVTAGGLDIRNNIFSISAPVGANRYAVLCNAPATVFATIDYNDYHTSGPNLCYLGANIPNLAAWQTATGQDLHSVSGDPEFVAAGNLHILPCGYSPVRNAGVAIASVTVDIDGNTRGIMPDIGAAEDGYISMALTGNPTNISCSGMADGTVGTLVSGGCAPYGYAWSNGATTAGLTGLSAGIYSVTVTDAASFTAAGSWTVSEPPAAGAFLEEFELPAFPPACWTNTGISGSSLWFRSTDASSYGVGTACAVAKLFNQPYVVSELKTMLFDVSDLVNPELNFDYAYASISNDPTDEALTVYGSTDQGTTWTTILALQGGATGPLNTGGVTAQEFTPLTTQWASHTISCPYFNVLKLVVGDLGNDVYVDRWFITAAPKAQTVAASDVGICSATLQGQVNANNLTTTVTFQYGTTLAYGTTIPAVPGLINGNVSWSVIGSLTNLTSNTLYHYRVVGVNSKGTAYGEDRTFFTACNPPVLSNATVSVHNVILTWPAVVPLPIHYYIEVRTEHMPGNPEGLVYSNYLATGWWDWVNQTWHTYYTVEVNVGNLAAGTQYTVWLRSECCEGHYSSWMAPFGFTTTEVPGEVVIIDLNVDGSSCFDATSTIYVAGGGSYFNVSNIGSVTFIAGERIHFLSGTTVQPGGYLHGYISNIYCYNSVPALPAVTEGGEETPVVREPAWFAIYPNPTTGNFILELKGDRQRGNIKVEVYGMRGDKVLSSEMTGEKKHEFVTAQLPTGLYFVKVVAGEYTETVKLIRTR